MEEKGLKRAGKYNHVEAYCLMHYGCKDCSSIEILWNSRDGVTPFIIKCLECGGEANHVRWELDDCLPDFKPSLGMRVFVDITLEKVHEYAKKRIDSFKGTEHEIKPESTRYKEVLKSVMENMYHNGEAPDIIVWK